MRARRKPQSDAQLATAWLKEANAAGLTSGRVFRAACYVIAATRAKHPEELSPETILTAITEAEKGLGSTDTKAHQVEGILRGKTCATCDYGGRFIALLDRLDCTLVTPAVKVCPSNWCCHWSGRDEA